MIKRYEYKTKYLPPKKTGRFLTLRLQHSQTLKSRKPLRSKEICGPPWFSWACLGCHSNHHLSFRLLQTSWGMMIDWECAGDLYICIHTIQSLTWIDIYIYMYSYTYTGWTNFFFGSFQDEGFKINFKHFPISQFKIQKSEHLKLLLTTTLEQVVILQGWNKTFTLHIFEQRMEFCTSMFPWRYDGRSKAQ